MDAEPALNFPGMELVALCCAMALLDKMSHEELGVFREAEKLSRTPLRHAFGLRAHF